MIWLPFETENVAVSGIPADGRANVTVEGGSNLIAGADNEIKVICTAENGTQKVYTIIAKRAASHDGATEPTEPPTEPSEPVTEPSEPATELSVPATDPSTPADPETPNTPEQTGGIPWRTLLIVGVACLGTGMSLTMTELGGFSVCIRIWRWSSVLPLALWACSWWQWLIRSIIGC